ncbi:MAG: hypothetical protein GY799_09095 [Desulfobulbaceae bacterium]|nr:hypothetical protein [Desulfobulbaceae bacterium]
MNHGNENIIAKAGKAANGRVKFATELNIASPGFACSPIFIVTEEYFAYLNPEALKILGAASQEEMLGQPILECVHPDFHNILNKQTDMLL